MSNQTVKQIMRKHPISIQCQTPLNEIIHILSTSLQDHLPVVNSSKQLLGMVSLIECQKVLLISAYHCDKPIKVNDIMVKQFTTLNQDQRLSDVAITTQALTENLFPVVKDDKLIGIIKRTDLLVHLQQSLNHCSQTKKSKQFVQ